MVVVGESDNVQPGDVSGVGEVVLGGTGAIGEVGVAVQIGPQDLRRLGHRQ